MLYQRLTYMLYRQTCFIGDRHASSETDMAIWRPTCVVQSDFRHIYLFVYFWLSIHFGPNGSPTYKLSGCPCNQSYRGLNFSCKLFTISCNCVCKFLQKDRNPLKYVLLEHQVIVAEVASSLGNPVLYIEAEK